MPIYQSIHINDSTKAFLWKIEESFDELLEGITLTPNSQQRVNSMKSDIHQRGFLSIRHLLKHVGYTDEDLEYDEYGKPHLKDGNYISITHSNEYTAIIISSKNPVGIDIEKQRDKIVKIAHKFTPISEYKTIANHEALVSKLTIVWGAKESLYKIYGKKQLLFLHHIYIEDFQLNETKTTGEIRFDGKITQHTIHFFEFNGFTCVYAY